LGIEGIHPTRRKILLRQLGVDGLIRVSKLWCEGHLQDAEYTGKNYNGVFTREVLSNIRCPYLILQGEEDQLCLVNQAHYIQFVVGNNSL